MWKKWRSIQNTKTQNEKLQMYEFALKAFVTVAVTVLLFWKIASAPIRFDFSSFLALFVSLFAVGTWIWLYQKWTTLFFRLENHVEQTSGTAAEPSRSAAASAGTAEDEKKLTAKADNELEYDIQHAEKELEQIQQEKRNTIENLIKKGPEIPEKERHHAFEQLAELDEKAYSIRERLSPLRKAYFHKVAQKQEWPFFRRSAVSDSIVELLNPDFVADATFETLNRHIGELRRELPQEAQKHLLSCGYVDETFQLTRKGYKHFHAVARAKTNGPAASLRKIKK